MDILKNNSLSFSKLCDSDEIDEEEIIYNDVSNADIMALIIKYPTLLYFLPFKIRLFQFLLN
jgi:hypothetical protein